MYVYAEKLDVCIWMYFYRDSPFTGSWWLGAGVGRWEAASWPQQHPRPVVVTSGLQKWCRVPGQCYKPPKSSAHPCMDSSGHGKQRKKGRKPASTAPLPRGSWASPAIFLMQHQNSRLMEMARCHPWPRLLLNRATSKWKAQYHIASSPNHLSSFRELPSKVPAHFINIPALLTPPAAPSFRRTSSSKEIPLISIFFFFSLSVLNLTSEIWQKQLIYFFSFFPLVMCFKPVGEDGEVRDPSVCGRRRCTAR